MAKKMKIIFSVFLLFLLIVCTKDPTGFEPVDRCCESYPVGPLRVVDSKIKSETWYPLNNTRYELERAEYEYYSTGLLKRKTRFSPDGSWKTISEYYYDEALNLIEEIVNDGNVYPDTIYYRYDDAGLLTQEETVRYGAGMVLRDTVFYEYDLEGSLSEWYKRNPNNEYSTIYSEKYEYANGLLNKKYFYIDDDLIRTFEYSYYNNIKIEELIYYYDCLERRILYCYDDRLLKLERGYFADETVICDQIIYDYNDTYELVVKKVFVPAYSSYVNHEIHYEYY